MGITRLTRLQILLSFQHFLLALTFVCIILWFDPTPVICVTTTAIEIQTVPSLQRQFFMQPLYRLLATMNLFFISINSLVISRRFLKWSHTICNYFGDQPLKFFFLLSIMPLRSIHVTACISSYCFFFFLFLNSVTVLCVYECFISFKSSGLLKDICIFGFLTVTNKLVMNVHITGFCLDIYFHFCRINTWEYNLCCIVSVCLAF